jgi:hypothetical protein
VRGAAASRYRRPGSPQPHCERYTQYDPPTALAICTVTCVSDVMLKRRVCAWMCTAVTHSRMRFEATARVASVVDAALIREGTALLLLLLYPPCGLKVPRVGRVLRESAFPCVQSDVHVLSLCTRVQNGHVSLVTVQLASGALAVIFTASTGDHATPSLSLAAAGSAPSADGDVVVDVAFLLVNGQLTVLDTATGSAWSAALARALPWWHARHVSL